VHSLVCFLTKGKDMCYLIKVDGELLAYFKDEGDANECAKVLAYIRKCEVTIEYVLTDCQLF
jgi:hypothetical protein